MKYIFQLLILVWTISLFNCDGRHRMKKSAQEVLSESKLLDSFSTNMTYIPETYSQVETDTILGNGYKVKLLQYADMNEHVLKKFTKDDIIHKEYYRDWKSVIEIFKNGITVATLEIDKKFLKTRLEGSKCKFDESIVASVNLMEYESLISDDIIFMANVKNPATDELFSFRMAVKSNGEVDIKEYSNQKLIV